MSFALTTDAVRQRQKTITRRLGWTWLKTGELLQPVVKCQGLKKGEKVEPIGGPIRVVRVTREQLDSGVSKREVVQEGFPEMTPGEFVAMFCRHNACAPDVIVTRIIFEYVEAM